MPSTMSSAAFNGPFVIGYTLSFGLMGALAVQAYIYYTRFTDDRKLIKTLVTVVLLLEILMTVLIFYGFWGSTTTNSQGLFISPNNFVSSFMTLAPITGLVTTLTHGFYCWRIASLRQSCLIPLPIMMVSLLQLASIIYLAQTQELFPSDESYNPSAGDDQVSYTLSPWLPTWLGSSVVCDLSITILMLLSLRPSKSHFRSNKSTLVKLTRLTVETGLVTTAAALLELILGVVYEQNFYHVAVFYMISKLYANCLLASLNFRLVLRSQSDPDLTAIVWDDVTSSTQSRKLGFRSTLQIRVPMELESDMVTNPDEAGPRKNPINDQTQTSETYELLDRV